MINVDPTYVNNNLTMCDDDDHFAFFLPCGADLGGEVTVSLFFSHAEGDIDFNAFETTDRSFSISLVGRGASSSDNEESTFAVRPGSMVTIIVRIAGAFIVPTQNYRMSISATWCRAPLTPSSQMISTA